MERKIGQSQRKDNAVHHVERDGPYACSDRGNRCRRHEQGAGSDEQFLMRTKEWCDQEKEGKEQKGTGHQKYG
jgi:hypothetical protein